MRSFIQDYLAELSQFPDEAPDYKDEQGIYHYPYLDDYWQEPERFPYLMYADDEIAGFAFVRRLEDHWNMSEIYVLPRFRRYGVGLECAAQLMRKHPGTWRIRYNKHNTPSRMVWEKLVWWLGAGDVERGELDANHGYIRFSV